MIGLRATGKVVRLASSLYPAPGRAEVIHALEEHYGKRVPLAEVIRLWWVSLSLDERARSRTLGELVAQAMVNCATFSGSVGLATYLDNRFSGRFESTIEWPPIVAVVLLLLAAWRRSFRVALVAQMVWVASAMFGSTISWHLALLSALVVVSSLFLARMLPNLGWAIAVIGFVTAVYSFLAGWIGVRAAGGPPAPTTAAILWTLFWLARSGALALPSMPYGSKTQLCRWPLFLGGLYGVIAYLESRSGGLPELLSTALAGVIIGALLFSLVTVRTRPAVALTFAIMFLTLAVQHFAIAGLRSQAMVLSAVAWVLVGLVSSQRKRIKIA
jgi:hypothetical protein